MFVTMKKISLYTIVAIASFALQPVFGQSLKTPAPSPSQTLKQSFALSEVSIEYSRPSAKGRVIFGDVVPFGKMWRTGANASTKITLAEAVTIQGTKVEPGTYAIYTIPNKESWEVLFYKDLKLGGSVNDYNKENELFRCTVKPSKLTEKVETFTINFNDITPNSCKLELSWENTKVALNVTADIETAIMKNIETVMNTDSKPYYAAASYYYENNKDGKKALEWATLATTQNPKAYWVMLLKAKIEAKNGDKKAAEVSANKVKEMAKEAKNDDYVTMADKFLAELKK